MVTSPPNDVQLDNKNDTILPRLNISLMDPDGESPPERLWPTSERPSSHDMRVRGAGPDSDPVRGAVPAQEPGSDLSLRVTSVG